MAPVAVGGPQDAAAGLREIMAEATSAQTRLDKLVTVIAANMVAEVCSIYLRRAVTRWNCLPPRPQSHRRPSHPHEGR